MNRKSKAKQVIDNCLGCGSDGAESCVSIQSGLITDCFKAIVLTDEELALLAGAGRQVIEKNILRKIRQYRTQHNSDLANHPSTQFQSKPELPQEG